MKYGRRHDEVLVPTQNAFIISHICMLLHLFNPLANFSKPVEPVNYKPGMLKELRDFV
jgi:hypothetical protein